MYLLPIFLLVTCLVTASTFPALEYSTVKIITSPCYGKINNVYTKPGKLVSPNRPLLAMICYDGTPLTNDASSRVYIEWIYSDCYGVVNDVLVEPEAVVQLDNG